MASDRLISNHPSLYSTQPFVFGEISLLARSRTCRTGSGIIQMGTKMCTLLTPSLTGVHEPAPSLPLYPLYCKQLFSHECDVSSQIWVAPFFFPKLPCGPCDLVSHSEWEEQKLTIFMNLGDARFAGETVRRNSRLRSWITKSQQKTNKTRARPATEPRLPPARSPETQARKAQHQHRVIPDRMGKP